ncbi:6749_t:CDS:2, partial [Racocetra fulgida]
NGLYYQPTCQNNTQKNGLNGHSNHSTNNLSNGPHPMQAIIDKIPLADLEDIGIRVEPINPNIKNIMITGGADFMSFILREKKIDTIFHLAAQTHVDNSFGDSFEFTKNNVMGTHVMLEAAKVHGIKRFIHVSTDEVYGEVAKTSVAPSNPYSATKAAAECLVQAYHKSFGLPIIITRSNNIYGPYQYPEKICSKFICNGSNSRKYLYAGDVADALDIILHKGQVGEIYNIGSNFEISNLELARTLIRKFGYKEEEHIEFVQDRAFNDRRYAVDYRKLR